MSLCFSFEKQRDAPYIPFFYKATRPFGRKYKSKQEFLMKTKLDARLSAVADCVRHDAYLADVGTDHAYLPVFLAETGKIRRAIASDIHKGPLERAEKNIRAAGLEDRILTILTDGLHGIESYPITDIAIAGMGGLMIAGILEAAPFVRERRPHLILQPMQNAPELRAYLAENGFAIHREKQLIADGKYYQILCAAYDGVKRQFSACELLLGQYNIEHKKENRDVFSAFCKRHIALLTEKIHGRALGGQNTDEELALLATLQSELNLL